MAAGVAGRIRTVEDIVGLLDAQKKVASKLTHFPPRDVDAIAS